MFVHETIRIMKLPLHWFVAQVFCWDWEQASLNVLPSLVLPSPVLQTLSPANGTGQFCSQ